MNKNNLKTVRKYLRFTELDLTDHIQALREESNEQKNHCVNEQNLAKSIRWYKAWRDCELTDELVQQLIQADKLLENKIEEMQTAAKNLAKWEQRQLKKAGRPYAETVVATLSPDYVDIKDGYDERYYGIFQHETDVVSKYRITMRDDEPTGERVSDCLNDMAEIREAEICEAAKVLDDFLETSRVERDYAIKMDSDFRNLLNLPKTIGKKWDRFFEQLDKFQGYYFTTTMLAMIAAFKLTPDDVCAIRDYGYDIKIHHFSDTVVPCLILR